MAQDTYKVYARLDGAGNIIEPPNSSAFLSDTDGLTQIDEGTGDKYHHAQGNYFPGGLTTMDNIPLYRWDGTQVVTRTEEEIEEDRVALPGPEPSEVEKLQSENKLLTAQVTALTDQNDFQEELVVELANIVYA